MGIVSENIKKYYSNPMCSQYNNDICKVYGGRCKKYRKRNVLLLCRKKNEEEQ